MNIRNGAYIMLSALSVVLVHVVWKVHQEQLVVRKELARITNFAAHTNTHIQVPQPMVERLVDKTQVWREVQESVKDTVVQVFAQIAEVDLLQPYKTPHQAAATGSGFIINEQGDLITNAHVVNQAKSIWIQIPSMGKRVIEVDLISLSPDRDLALLRIKENDLLAIKSSLGKVPYLALGDSDIVRRADVVMAMGYPLGQQSLKSTTGVISGRERHMIQIDAAINPGSSGGPLLNINGEVIGINSSGFVEAQNVGYAIPSNELKIVLQDMYKVPLLRRPFLGVLFNNGTETLARYLGNPEPGGCYVVEVIDNSTLAKAGVQRGDMIYSINNLPVDIYGDMTLPWSEDKVSIIDYVSRLSIGQEISLVVYRNGERKEMSVAFDQAELPAIRKIYPGYEEIDYEVFAGMVVMPLTINHIQLLAQAAPGLTRFGEISKQGRSALVVTHIFPSSQLYRSRTITVGSTLNEVNGFEVYTLADLRKALKEGDGVFLTIRASDHVARASDNVFVTLPFQKLLDDEIKLSRDYHYPLSQTAHALLKERQQAQQLLVVQQSTEQKQLVS